jgi:hypothetical protein
MTGATTTAGGGGGGGGAVLQLTTAAQTSSEKQDFRTRVVAGTVASGTGRAGCRDHRMGRAMDAQSAAFAGLDNWPFVLPLAAQAGSGVDRGIR